MNELPYFKFYVRDWLSSPSVIEMDKGDRGVYIQLLAHCWNSDGLSGDFELLSRLVGTDDVSQIIAKHFTKKIKGKFWNEKLYEQKTKLLDNQKKSIKAIRKRWNKRDTNVHTDVLRTNIPVLEGEGEREKAFKDLKSKDSYGLDKNGKLKPGFILGMDGRPMPVHPDA